MGGTSPDSRNRYKYARRRRRLWAGHGCHSLNQSVPHFAAWQTPTDRLRVSCLCGREGGDYPPQGHGGDAHSRSSHIPRHAALRPGLRRREQQPGEAVCPHTSAVCQAERPISTTALPKQPAGVITPLLRD